MAKPPNLFFDPHTPKPVRMYDYWRGGHNNYEADRRKAGEIERWYPGVRQMVADNAAFTARAVTWAARNGISQFLDVGSGLPTGACIHVTARTVIPDARVAYVDHDREVIDEGALILDKDGGEGVAFVQADLRDPAAVLADPGLRKVVALDEPGCVILAMVFQYMPAEQAREVVSGYATRLVPGSAVVISVPRNDDPASFAEVRAAWPDGELYNHSREEIASFFGAGLEMIPPSLVLARGWRGGMQAANIAPARPTYVLGGAGQKPLAR